jgi:hypothetical protein
MPKGDEPFGIRWLGMALADSSNMSALVATSGMRRIGLTEHRRPAFAKLSAF